MRTPSAVCEQCVSGSAGAVSSPDLDAQLGHHAGHAAACAGWAQCAHQRRLANATRTDHCNQNELVLLITVCSGGLHPGACEPSHENAFPVSVSDSADADSAPPVIRNDNKDGLSRPSGGLTLQMWYALCERQGLFLFVTRSAATLRSFCSLLSTLCAHQRSSTHFHGRAQLRHDGRARGDCFVALWRPGARDRQPRGAPDSTRRRGAPPLPR